MASSEDGLFGRLSLTAMMTAAIVAVGSLALAVSIAAFENGSGEIAQPAILVPAGLTVFMIVAVLIVLRTAAQHPLAAMVGQVEKLAAGDLSARIPGRGRGGVIGDLARAIENLRNALREHQEAEAQLAFERQEQDEQRSQTESQRAAAAKVHAAVVKLVAAAVSRLASGDFGVRINVNFPPAYQGLRDDFNATAEALQDLLFRIEDSGAVLAGNVDELGRIAGEITRLTERQAAALQQTAPALFEVQRLVEQSAASAGDARAFADAASGDARRSEEVVSDAIRAMGAIEKSAQEINKIIGVIDDIAFQTNLLALNAGVEAARAGDAGRGFAVVASEVRGLAQRSAEAAKEIKILISASGNQVKAGSRLVTETGEVIGRIGEQIERIKAAIADMAASAGAQTTGLRDIARDVSAIEAAINQMDTQAGKLSTAAQALAGEAETFPTLAQGYRGDFASETTPTHPAHSSLEATTAPRMPRAIGAAALELRHGVDPDGVDWQEF